LLRTFPPIAEDHIRWQGEPSVELYPRMLQPREGKLEYHIVKHKFDAFFETALDAILRYHEADTVIITGTATNACCESTARSAFNARLQGSIPQRPERDLRRRHAPGNFKECRPVVWARRLERRIAGGDGSSLRDKLQVMTSAPVGLLGLFGRVDA